MGQNKHYFYIIPGDATYNRGDRINLMSQLALLQKYFPDNPIYFESRRPKLDNQWYPAQAVKRHFWPSLEQLKFWRQAKIIIWGGGALLMDNASRVKIPYYAGLIFIIKKIFRRPVMAWAQGMIINTGWGRFWANQALNSVDIITVRDEDSLEAVKRVNPALKAQITADPAVLATPGTAEAGRQVLDTLGLPNDGKPIIVFTNTFSPLRYQAKSVIPTFISAKFGRKKRHQPEKLAQLKASIVKLIDLAVQNFGAYILLLPTYPAPWEGPDDIEIFKAIKNSCHYSSQVFILEKDEYSPKDYLAMWHHFTAVISLPMHHNIASVINNVPCINIYYEPKGRQFFERLQATDRLISLEDFSQDNGALQVLKMLKQTLANWPVLSIETKKNLLPIQQAAENNAIILRHYLDSINPVAGIHTDDSR